MEEINMREIEIFLAVAKNQNISRTAEELYISQSALSSWIARMEEYCGVKLFRRTNRGVVLTPEGELLYGSLDIAYKRFKVSVEEICGTYLEQKPNTLRIGCLNRSAVMDTFRGKSGQFSERFPERNVTFERFNFHELRDRLLCEQLDLAFTISSDIEAYTEFEMLPLKKFPLLFVVKEKTKDLGELNGKILVIEAPTSRRWAEQTCAENGIVPAGIKYVNSYIVMTTLAASGDYFAVDGEFVTNNIYTSATDMIPAENSPDVQVVLAWKKGPVSDAVKDFIDFCKE